MRAPAARLRPGGGQRQRRLEALAAVREARLCGGAPAAYAGEGGGGVSLQSEMAAEVDQQLC